MTKKLSTMAPERLTAVIIGIFLGLVAAALLTLPLSLTTHTLRPNRTPYSCLRILLSQHRHSRLSSRMIYKPFIKNFRLSGNSREQVRQNSDEPENFILIRHQCHHRWSHPRHQQNRLYPQHTTCAKLHPVRTTTHRRQRRSDAPQSGTPGHGNLWLIYKTNSPVPTKITDADVSEAREADTKLMALGRHLRCPIMTNDYNLNRVAELQGVTVLNINDLANAVKAIFLPGETLTVKIIQQGRESDQGVGYLEDGTMVVVENGSHLVDATARVIVTKVLQTAAGRMIFANFKL